MKNIAFYCLALCISQLVLPLAHAQNATTEFTKAPPLTLQSGDLKVRIAPARAWTFDEIRYRDQLLTVPASQSGLVLNFGGAQFVGSGHKEAGTEKVASVVLNLDDKTTDPLQGGEHAGKEVELVKESTLGETRLKSIIRLKEGKLECEQFLTAQEDVEVNLVYAFMFPWTTTTTEWVAKTVKGTIREGGFTSKDRAWELRDDVVWAAIYHPEFKVAAITSYEGESQSGAGVKHGYWNIHKGYHKQYYQPLGKTTLVKDKTYHWKARVAFVQSEAAQWKVDVQKQMTQ